MKQIFTLLFLLVTSFSLQAQDSGSKKYSSKISTSGKEKTINYNGQWKGGFNETSYGYTGFADNDITYVLELTTEGSRVSGYSYTYFQEGNKKYYTICRLTGSLDRDAKEIVVTEIERTKFNTPPNFQNCFQTHKLYYEKDSDDLEVLRGTWGPAPNQSGNCGRGTTVLSRRIVNRLPLGIKPTDKTDIAKSNAKKPAPPKHEIHQKKPSSVIAGKTAPPVRKSPEVKRNTEQNPVAKSESPVRDQLSTNARINSNSTITAPVKGFENRRSDIIKTISIEQPTFHLDFYDNGEIDGDSISVFYNGKIVLSHQRLTDKPISLTLSLDKNTKENVLTMYADNLGAIPPNTAVMIVMDGDKRYEVRIESDLAKSGSIVFTRDY